MKTRNNVSFLMVHYGNIFVPSEVEKKQEDNAVVVGVKGQFLNTYSV